MAIRRVLVVLVAAVLVDPAAATAKEIEKAQVCGASACFTFDRGNSGGKLVLFEDAGPPAQPPVRASAWYRLRITVAGEDTERFTFTNAYVPSIDRIRRRAEGGGYEWDAVIDDLRPVLRNVAAGLDPLPASSLEGVDRRPYPGGRVTAPARASVPTPREGSGTRWLVTGVAGAAAVGLVLGAAVRRRRRRPPAAS